MPKLVWRRVDADIPLLAFPLLGRPGAMIEVRRLAVSKVLSAGQGSQHTLRPFPLAVTSKVKAVNDRLKEWSRTIKRDVIAVYLAARDPRVPWYAKVLALCVAGYALSPIDLIPDFIPVLGYLDDVVIVPLGILAVVKLIPPGIMAEHRTAAAVIAERPTSLTAAVVIADMGSLNRARHVVGIPTLYCVGSLLAHLCGFVRALHRNWI